MKYEQIVNKIIFILFYRTYIEARYIVVRYMTALLDYRKCQVILLDKISYNQSCKNAVYPSYSNI